MRKVIRALLLFSFLLGAPAISLPTANTEQPKNAKNDSPTVTLPDRLVAKPGRYFHLTATVAGGVNVAKLRWMVPDAFTPLDPFVPQPPAGTMVWSCDTDGTYTVTCIGAAGDVPSNIATCTVTVGTPAPPTPPTPPPTDPLVQAFQAGYSADKDIDRATNLQFLQGVYAGMASQATNWTAVTNVAQAVAVMKSAVEQSPTNPSGLTTAQVQNLRKAIAVELAATFGTDGTKSITLVALVMELSKIAAALKGVK